MGTIKVLHVAHVRAEGIGGPAISVPSLVRAQNKTPGMKAALLVTSRERTPPTGPDYQTFVYSQFSGEIFSPKNLGPFAKPDLVVFHSTYIPVHMLIARRLNRHGIPYIITPRGGMTKGAQRIKWFKKLLGNIVAFNHFVKRCLAVHCLTEKEAEQSAFWGKPMFVVGNGIDLPEVGYVATPGATQEIRIVFVGRLSIWHKGLDILLHAAALAKTDLLRAGASVHIYGPDHEGSRAQLVRDIERLDLGEVVYLHQAVVGEQKSRVLRDADAFVLTSRFEGHPMALLEALAHGLPCLVTPGTNMAEEIQGAGAGWRVECDPWSVADGLRRIVTERQRLRGMGIAARKLASQYEWADVAARLKDIYERILSGTDFTILHERSVVGDRTRVGA